MRHGNGFLSAPLLARQSRPNGSVTGDLPTPGELLNELGIPTDVATTPGAVPFRAGNWNFETGDYTIPFGDTMWGIATTYLGRGNRWLEIWQMQEFPVGTPNRLNRWHNKPDPSSKNLGRPYMEGDILRMPREAVARAKSFYDQGVESAPTTPGAPGSMPDYVAPEKEGESGLPKYALPLGLTALVLVGAWAFTR